MIELKNICKKFDDKTVLNQLNMVIKDSSFCAIKGKSGCGKTTLFKIMGLLDSYKGDIYIDTILVDKHNREKIRKQNLSYVFQDAYLLEYLSTYENIILPIVNLKRNVEEVEIDELLTRLNIFDLKHVKVSKLSGGERTRVSIARALITHPKYILMDEPIGNLDAETARGIMILLKEIFDKTGTTIVMVTHSNDYDELYSSIIHLDNGAAYEA